VDGLIGGMEPVFVSVALYIVVNLLWHKSVTQVRNLSTIGGSTVKECTRRILRHVLSNKCAMNMNWKGRGDKTAFCDMELCKVIKS